MNQLRVHAAPEPSLEGILHIGFASTSELNIHERSVLVHDFLTLMCRRHQRADQEAADEHGPDGDAQGKSTKEPRVVRGEQYKLRLVLASPRTRDAVTPPKNVRHRVKRVAVDVLILAKPAIRASTGLGRRQIIERFEFDVTVFTVDVREGVMHVVFVGPPFG